MADKEMAFAYDNTSVRVVMIDGQPWFVAKDVCDVLEHSNSRKALERLDDDEKGVTNVYTLGGTQQMSIVNEPGLYNLILTSRKPEAKAFKRWITHEVLPSIRQTGSYTLPQAPTPKLPHNYLEALEALVVQVKETIRLQERIEQLAPKAEGYDVFLDGQNAKPIGEVAKVIGWGRNRMFAWLREKRILMTSNVPYQDYVDAGYFRVREVPKSHGERLVNHVQTLVTAKGMNWLMHKLKQDEILVL